jgi:hypothetical protein
LTGNGWVLIKQQWFSISQLQAASDFQSVAGTAGSIVTLLK